MQKMKFSSNTDKTFFRLVGNVCNSRNSCIFIALYFWDVRYYTLDCKIVNPVCQKYHLMLIVDWYSGLWDWPFSSWWVMGRIQKFIHWPDQIFLRSDLTLWTVGSNIILKKMTRYVSTLQTFNQITATKLAQFSVCLFRGRTKLWKWALNLKLTKSEHACNKLVWNISPSYLQFVSWSWF